MSWVQVPPEQLFFIFQKKELLRLVVLPCIDLCRSNTFHVCSVFDVLVFLSSVQFDLSCV